MANETKTITFSVEQINKMLLQKANELGYYVPNGNDLNFVVDIQPIIIEVIER